jgi:hypothetical protein
MRHHQGRIGRDPIIAVHDLAVMDQSGTNDFHGFRLHLGLERAPQQALLALQNFVRFLSTQHQSADLDEEACADPGREALGGSVEVMMRHEATEIGR